MSEATRGMFHDMAVQRGYVPKECTLDGQIVMLLVSKGEDPCAGCNEDRAVCNGCRSRTS